MFEAVDVKFWGFLQNLVFSLIYENILDVYTNVQHLASLLLEKYEETMFQTVRLNSIKLHEPKI